MSFAAFQNPFLSISSHYHERQDSYMPTQMPRLHHRQPSLSDSSSSASSPTASDFGHNHPPQMDPNGHLSNIPAYASATDQNGYLFHTQLPMEQTSSISQGLGTFRGQQPQAYQLGLPQNHASYQPSAYSHSLQPQNFSMSGTHPGYPGDMEQFIDYGQTDDGVHSSPSSQNSSDYGYHASDNSEPSPEETEDYLRRSLSIPAPRPLNLSSLPNEPFGSKPPKISDQIKLAIWGSPGHRLTLRQIYTAIEERYPSYRDATDKPWQRSIRHNLSLKAMFVRLERPVSHPGKGYYWSLNVRNGEGNKRDRKRKDPRGERGLKAEDEEYELSDASSESLGQPSRRAPARRTDTARMYAPPQPQSLQPQGGMRYGPAAMMGPPGQQQQAMFAQAPVYPGAYAGMGMNMAPPAQGPAYQMGGIGFAVQGGQAAPGPVPWGLQQPGAQYVMEGQHGHPAYGPYQPPPIAPQDLQMGQGPYVQGGGRARRPHSATSPEDDEEEIRRGAPRIRPGTQ